MSERSVVLRKRGPVARLTLARPSQANRLSPELLRELADAAASIAEDDAVRVVILRAEGADFCAGWTPEAIEQARGGLTAAFEAIATLPQSVIAAIQGNALSGGLELALSCDVRIAGEDARFGFPETEHGLIPLAGGSARLPRIVGRGAAIELLLTGRSVEAAEARRIGLVSRVVATADLAAEVEAIAARIAERGPIAARLAKEAVRRGMDLPLDQALRMETDLTILLQTTKDRAEGVRAFKEKRPPRFRGR
ncbi:MAG: hypothetical protein EXR43_01875 [Dehalococcoidia bacterium]|nr:hypothetical protein [Dehalococcoidia bacterium]